jgi:hypothetical protein
VCNNNVPLMQTDLSVYKPPTKYTTADKKQPTDLEQRGQLLVRHFFPPLVLHLLPQLLVLGVERLDFVVVMSFWGLWCVFVCVCVCVGGWVGGSKI